MYRNTLIIRFTYIWCAFTLLSGGKITAQEGASETYYKLRGSSREALREERYEDVISCYQGILEITPDHPGFHYEIGRMYAVQEQWKQAGMHLQQALQLGYPLHSGIDTLFAPLLERDSNGALQELITGSMKPVENSSIAFTIAERDLTPECITFDPVGRHFYLGSMWKHKIVRVDMQGTAVDFIPENSDGLRSVAGMRVDADRRILWALSIVSSIVPSGDLSRDGWSALYKYDLVSGRLLDKIVLWKAGERHLLNDLTLTHEGNLFITDSQAGAVYYHEAGTDSLELWFQSDQMMFPNGIDISSDGALLYVAAGSMGVLRINTADKQSCRLGLPRDVSLYGIDGMYCHENSLVCVQNGLERISRFYLDKTGSRVIFAEVIERGNPLFSLPTTGVIAGNVFYYIANSQINRTDRSQKLLPAAQLDDIYILKTTL